MADRNSDPLTLGADKVTIAANVASALEAIAARPLAIAVIDRNLGATTSEDVAREPGRRGIPYVFATG